MSNLSNELSKAIEEAYSLLEKQSSRINTLHPKAMNIVNQIRPLGRYEKTLYWVQNGEMFGECYNFLREPIQKAELSNNGCTIFFKRKMRAEVFINKMIYLAFAIIPDNLLENVAGFEVVPMEDSPYCEKFSLTLIKRTLPKEIANQKMCW